VLSIVNYEKEGAVMGYPVRVQKVERPTNRSYYVNFPLAMAEALDIKKVRHSNGLSKIKTP
jgi:hypothetical protein